MPTEKIDSDSHFYRNDRGGLQLKDEHIDTSESPVIKSPKVIWRGPIQGFLEQRRKEKQADSVAGQVLSVPGADQQLKLSSAAVIDSPGFAAWFKGSVVKNPDQSPRMCYHGTGAKIVHFSYDFTSVGHDQHGSGFYFTDSPETASAYAVKRNPRDEEKPGGEQANVIPVYLSIKNPIYVNGDGKGTQRALNRREVQAIIQASPTLKETLSNFGDPASDGLQNVLREAVDVYSAYDNLLKQLNILSGDFFTCKGGVERFNLILKKLTNYDGVVATFGEQEHHYVAWFPHQIRSALSGHSFDAEGGSTA